MSVFRRGDDKMVPGTRTRPEEFEEQLSKHLIVKLLAILGPCSTWRRQRGQAVGQDCDMGQTPYGARRERVEYEDDPQHAELIIHQLGLSSSSRSVSTPNEISKPRVDHSNELNCANHTLYRSATMRLRYLALDRLDLEFPSKELARWMQTPTVGDMEALKRAAKYVIRHGRLIQEFVREMEEPYHVGVYTGSDHAGCLKTRKIT